MKLIKVKNEKEHLLTILKPIKDEILLIIDTNNDLATIICGENISETIKEFLNIDSIEELNRYNRRVLIEHVINNKLIQIGNSSLLSNFSD